MWIPWTDKYLNDKRKTRVKDPSFEFEESELEKMSIIIGYFSMSWYTARAAPFRPVVDYMNYPV